MPKFIGIQSGHKNITANCDPVLATETGALGEMDFNWNVTLALSSILQRYGFQVQVDDANANCSGNPENTLGKDFDLYLSIHAEGAPAGGNIVAPDPSVDASNAESIRIVNAIKSVYFADTGIADNPQIDTPAMRYYYMWNVLTANTPCAIIECGDLQDPHDKVILADVNRVADGIAHGICNAFNVAWNGSTSVPPDPCKDIKAELELSKQNEQVLQFEYNSVLKENTQLKLDKTAVPVSITKEGGQPSKENTGTGNENGFVYAINEILSFLNLKTKV